MVAPVSEVTALLATLESGDEAAMNQLVPLVYQELRLLARRHLAGQRQGHTLQTADLGGGAYLKLVNPPAHRPRFQDDQARVALGDSVAVSRARGRETGMTPERFRQVEQLATLVLDQDQRERTEFLDRACSGDDDLRREVESLLASDAKVGNFLDEPAAQIVADRPTAPVGRYL